MLPLATAHAALRAEPSDDEKKAFAAAEQSYHDGAFDVVNDRVAALLKKYPKSELLPQAEILQAQALYQLGRDDAAARRVHPADRSGARAAAGRHALLAGAGAARRAEMAGGGGEIPCAARAA